MEKNNINNGLITKIWGGPMWESLHSITFGYPIHPTTEQQHNYYTYFKYVGTVLPCKYCRESYIQFINNGCTKLTMDVLKNRDSLTKWFYYIHEAVNNKLDVNYAVTYNDVVNRYESYRAKCSVDPIPTKTKGCTMPLNLKADSYSIAEQKDCPIISYQIAKEFIYYAKQRGIDNTFFSFINKIKDEKQFADILKNKNSILWKDRNKQASDIISYMRKNSIKSIEHEEKWKGLPTIEETKLILLSSSTLSCKNLSDIIKILPRNNINHKKRYILINL